MTSLQRQVMAVLKARHIRKAGDSIKLEPIAEFLLDDQTTSQEIAAALGRLVVLGHLTYKGDRWTLTEAGETYIAG